MGPLVWSLTSLNGSEVRVFFFIGYVSGMEGETAPRVHLVPKAETTNHLEASRSKSQRSSSESSSPAVRAF